MRFNHRICATLFGIVLAIGGLVNLASAEEGAKNYTVSANSTDAAVGSNGKIDVTISPAKGFKWNKDFPAMLTFKAGAESFATLSTTEIKSDGFQVSEKSASAAAEFKGNQAGTQTVTGQLRFSVCNEESCIIATEDLSVNLSVK